MNDVPTPRSSLDLAQRLLDRCGGDLREALTYAAFRAQVAAALRETWPDGVAANPTTERSS